MLVATFGPTTAWVGRAITYEGDQFMLEGHGQITPAAVVQYDAQGHLDWSSDGLRQWVYEVATVTPAPAQGGAAAPRIASRQAYASDASRPEGAPGIGVAGFVCVLVGLLIPLVGIVGLVLSILGYRQAKRENRPAGLALAGMIIGIVVTVVSLILLLVSIPLFLNQRDKAKDSAVKEAIHTIEIGIQTYAVDHNDAYPDPSMVSESGLASSVDFWPTNPYTGLPMAQGTGQGDFSYTVSEDGGSFRLTGYGKGGEVIITVPLGI